jgi:hypothetical protein
VGLSKVGLERDSLSVVGYGGSELVPVAVHLAAEVVGQPVLRVELDDLARQERSPDFFGRSLSSTTPPGSGGILTTQSHGAKKQQWLRSSPSSVQLGRGAKQKSRLPCPALGITRKRSSNGLMLAP